MGLSHNIKKLMRCQRGAVAILFVLCLPVLLGFAALAVDLARLNLTKVELQNAADAAALAGAHSLSDPGGQPYNWSAATATTLDVARHNFANSTQIQDVLVETGYWNLQNPSLGLRPYNTPGLPDAGDVAAIRATIAISSTKNNGPLKLFFAPILGIADRTIQVSAISVLPSPEGGTDIFPLAIEKSDFDNYWDSDIRRPKMDHHTHKPHDFEFDTSTNDHDHDHENEYRKIGDVTHVSHAGFNSIPSNKDVAVFVVNNDHSGDSEHIYAIAGFHIDGEVVSDHKHYVKGHFIDNVLIGTTKPGAGNGVPYGAYSPPILVQ